MPVIGMIVLALTIALGVFIFGVSMQSAYVESNYTAANQTLIPYQLANAWWMGVAILVCILGMGFAFWYFWG
jgi:hypothetical protein